MNLKKYLQISTLILVNLIFSGCVYFFKAQVYSITAVNLNEKDSSWVFENEKVKITYDFWARDGNMSFEIYNKLETPIYIDWKNSSFIFNGNKKDYWLEQTNSLSNSTITGMNTRLLGNMSNSTIQKSTSTSIASSIKIERITFLPPRAKLNFTQFKLLNSVYYTLQSPSIIKEKSKVAPKRLAIKFMQPFTINNTPLNFRNYLALTMTENSKDYFYIDNEFYLSKVIEMNDYEFDKSYSNKMSFYSDEILTPKRIKTEKYKPN